MFAVREIIKDKLYATETLNGSDSFTECFNQWRDPMYIRDYLKQQPATQEFYGVGLKEAVKKILRESEQFRSKILKIVKGEEDYSTLDNFIFQPLHKNDDFNIPLLSAKAYGRGINTSFLRLYAIRLSDGSYIVVGGLIKMHLSLQESKEGQRILDTLNEWTEYLQKNNIDDSFDLGVLVNET